MIASAGRVGFRWDPSMPGWERHGPPGLSNLAGPIQHFRSAILSAWRDKISGGFCVRNGFRGGPLLDVRGSHQLLISSLVRKRDKALLRCVTVGGVWNGFLSGKMRGEAVPCRFCGGADGDGHLFWDCPFLLFLRFVKILSFMISLESLLWYGRLLLLSGVNGESPWAVTADEAAVNMQAGVDWDAPADRMPANPDVWTDGSFVRRGHWCCFCWLWELCSLAC